ncbi:P-loop containing nucleoside triphosphate hydrolase protein [Cercophora newfieldiana]|uniref:P-loop containing nucleoside triphosphate hydrolase protein n=1 Tax=Cercophora newfieldiana TaxID=92897 RepID=A0AA40CJ42_9PEZI|nr:P-loop containing nucleoside triphosphate hydrolase protein [Cercophora newfieldiana]
MARGLQPPRGIKQEPGRTESSLPSPARTRRDGSMAITPDRKQNVRGVRSDAPSVDTRHVAPSAVGEDDEDSDVQFMEMKPLVGGNKLGSSFASASQNAQASFIGPNLALKDFGQKLKDINDALGELQARGIQHVANLPELVLVGDQSSGKSSIMSAIAGLTLPRSTGTCTRCPIHIRVSRADDWSCRVYLKIDYAYHQRDRPISEKDVTAKDKFPPWIALDPNQVDRREFKTIRDKFDPEDVENVLTCAQLAILNPSIPYQQYIPKLKGEVSEETRLLDLKRIKALEAESMAQFSPNTVALEVKGPDLADLNFYDLPGVFMSAKRDEDTFLERVVSNLACEYMQRPHALILWTVPMNQDAENSYAFSLIRKMKAGSRCVGIMTKADLLPAGSTDTWLAMLRGLAHQTGLGYFVTSRQGDDLDEQNKMEEAFFNRTADIGRDAGRDWPQVFDNFQDQCGVEKLKSYLSFKLGEEFSKVLPEVKQKVNDRISAIDQQLKAYPDPPPNPEMEIMGSLAAFSRDVRDRVQQQEFMSRWDHHFMEKFRKAILSAKPKYNVRDSPRNDQPPATSIAVIDLSGGSPVAHTPTRNRKHQLSNKEDDSREPKRPRPESASPVKQETADWPGIWQAVPNFNQRPITKTLADIRNMIRRNAIPGQPGLVSGAVYQPLFTEAAVGWHRYLSEFIKQTLDFVQMEIRAIMDRALGSVMNTTFYRESDIHMQAFIDGLRVELREQLTRLYNLECQRLFTKDEASLERNKAQERKVLVRHRHHFRWAAHNGDEPPPVVRRVEDLTEEELAQEAVTIQKQMARMLPDPFEQELSVAAYVRGYYLTAANRFVDNVAIHVMSGLFPDVARKIETYLPEKLGLSGGSATLEKMRDLMSEGPETERKRRELRAERERLDQGMAIIVGLESDNTGPIKSAPVNGHSMYNGMRHPHASHRAAPTVSAASEYGDT